MSFLPALRILALVAGAAFSTSAMAACSEAQAQAKMMELMDLMGPLMTRNSALAETISNELQTVMTQPVSDATCTTYDRLIVRARAGR
jgi:Tfp pilus assembly protein PilE